MSEETSVGGDGVEGGYYLCMVSEQEKTAEEETREHSSCLKLLLRLFVVLSLLQY